MTISDKITELTRKELQRVALTANYDYKPTLGFKLTNSDSSTDDCFTVSSVNEAEDIVIGFISTAQKGNIFVKDVYDETKPLFLRVKVILPV